MSADKRTDRDERRRRLGQNFLLPDVASAIIEECAFDGADLVVEVGAGRGSCTFLLADVPGLEIIAVEKDLHWATWLRSEVERRRLANVSVVHCDARRFRFPTRRPFRVFGSLPFGLTTALLRHLFDDPRSGPTRADLVVQWEVAQKRATMPPSSLLSTAWAPWWTFELGRRVPAHAFRPVPAVDGAVLRVRRRRPALLPERLAGQYAEFVREEWQ